MLASPASAPMRRPYALVEDGTATIEFDAHELSTEVETREIHHYTRFAAAGGRGRFAEGIWDKSTHVVRAMVVEEEGETSWERIEANPGKPEPETYEETSIPGVFARLEERNSKQFKQLIKIHRDALDENHRLIIFEWDEYQRDDTKTFQNVKVTELEASERLWKRGHGCRTCEH